MTATDDYIATRRLHNRVRLLVRQAEAKRETAKTSALEALRDHGENARAMFLANPDSVDLLRALGITDDDLSSEPEETSDA